MLKKTSHRKEKGTTFNDSWSWIRRTLTILTNKAILQVNGRNLFKWYVRPLLIILHKEL